MPVEPSSGNSSRKRWARETNNQCPPSSRGGTSGPRSKRPAAYSRAQTPARQAHDFRVICARGARVSLSNWLALRRSPRVSRSGAYLKMSSPVKMMNVEELKPLPVRCEWEGCHRNFRGYMPKGWRWLLTYWAPEPQLAVDASPDIEWL